jgi:hypothetical protein
VQAKIASLALFQQALRNWKFEGWGESGMGIQVQNTGTSESYHSIPADFDGLFGS